MSNEVERDSVERKEEGRGERESERWRREDVNKISRRFDYQGTC